MSLAQIVQLGKSRQREILLRRGVGPQRRVHSFEATKEMRRRIEMQEQN